MMRTWSRLGMHMCVYVYICVYVWLYKCLCECALALFKVLESYNNVKTSWGVTNLDQKCIKLEKIGVFILAH